MAPLRPVLRMNVDRPCLLGTKIGTLTVGLFFSLGPISSLGLFSKEASQAGDLGDKPVAFISGTGVKKVGSEAPSSSDHVGPGPGRAASSSYYQIFKAWGTRHVLQKITQV